MKCKRAAAWLLTLMMAFSMASCQSKNHEDSTDARTPDKVVFSNNSGTYYNNGHMLFLIGENDNVQPVVFERKEEKDGKEETYTKELLFQGSALVSNDTDIYAMNTDHEVFVYHDTFTEPAVVKQEALYEGTALYSLTETALTEAGEFETAIQERMQSVAKTYLTEQLREETEKLLEENKTDEDFGDLDIESAVEDRLPDYLKAHTDEVMQQKHDEFYQKAKEEVLDRGAGALWYGIVGFVDGNDGYIYVPLRINAEYLNEFSALDGKVFRIAKDGSKIEWVSSLKANDCTCKDDWFYYYNSGFAPTKEQPENVDTSVTGIYKSKSDGSESQKIAEITFDAAKNDRNADLVRYGVRDITVVGDWIYFRKASNDTEKYTLYRVSTGGGQPEKITGQLCSAYTVDSSSSTLYYLDRNEIGQPAHLYSRNLSDGKETVCFETENKHLGNPYSMNIDGSYLYFKDANSYSTSLVNIAENGSRKSAIDRDLLLYQKRPAGARYQIESGKIELLYSYLVVILEEDSFGGQKITYSEPTVTVWKDVEEVNAKLNRNMSSFALDENIS